MTECLHDVPMDEDCKDCCGTQGRLPKLVCHKCESKDRVIASYRVALERIAELGDIRSDECSLIAKQAITEPTKLQPGEQD